jgi:hypothetical protein
LDFDWIARRRDGMALCSSEFPQYHHDQDAKDVFRDTCKRSDDEAVQSLQSVCAPSERSKELYSIWTAAVAVSQPMFLYWAMFVLLSLLGATVSPFFFCYHTLHIAMQNEVLANVLASVFHNGRQLMFTMAFTACVVYVYTVRATKQRASAFDVLTLRCR